MLRDAEEGLIVPDMTTLLSMATKLHHEIYQNLAAHQNQLNAAQFIFIACWLCSIVSSYFVGKKVDLAESAPQKSIPKTDV